MFGKNKIHFYENILEKALVF